MMSGSRTPDRGRAEMCQNGSLQLAPELPIGARRADSHRASCDRSLYTKKGSHMWAPLITTRLKAGHERDLSRLEKELRKTEQPTSSRSVAHDAGSQRPQP